MKKYILTTILTAISTLSAQDFDRNVLVEIFTNSHCGLCPGAHAALDSYLATGGNASRVNYIYYHMSFPYPDDPLNHSSAADAAGRNSYYGPYTSTPKGFFDGSIQANNYNQWSSLLNSKIADKTPIKIELSGNRETGKFSITSDITMSQVSGDLVIHFIIVENIDYLGRNGISDHKHVMRKMATGATGETIPFSSNQIVEKTFDLQSGWIPENTGVVVFIQHSDTKKVYQSEFITYDELAVTGMEDEIGQVNKFEIFQNYPNPFNPSTVIRFNLPETQRITIEVFDLLGNKIVELFNDQIVAGKHEVVFNGGGLSSGMYIYRLSSEKFNASGKMLMIK